MRSALLIAGLLVAAGAVAERSVDTVHELACLPKENNQALSAAVGGLEGGDTVVAQFRRLHPNGAFYFVEMEPVGEGDYWTVLPKPEDREQQELTDEWWEALRNRAWIDPIIEERGCEISETSEQERDDDRFECIDEWMDDLGNEAAEYFVEIRDATGNRQARSADRVVEVIDPDDCESELTPIEIGFSRNLTVGETVRAQVGKPVFHWLCDGIVTRLGASGILRGDEICRACVVAAWFPVPIAAAALATGTTVHHREPRRVSDDQR